MVANPLAAFTTGMASESIMADVEYYVRTRALSHGSKLARPPDEHTPWDRQHGDNNHETPDSTIRFFSGWSHIF